MPDPAIVLAILGAAVVLFITEWVRVDLTALLVMLALAFAGVIDGTDAIRGFSNPAVITIASVLVLSGGLLRTGVAQIVGRQVLRLAGDSEVRLLALMMATVGVLSGVMNDIGVTALMLPVVLDIARRLGRSPSKLLIPLAFGSLLGGMTTLIGTTPNILIAGALADAGLEPFAMFDFTPVGVVALATGIAFMVLLGRHLLPERKVGREAATRDDLETVYELGEVLYALEIPPGSPLAGRTLAESRIGAALGLNVLAISRGAESRRAPAPQAVLAAGDRLTVKGSLDRFRALQGWKELVAEDAPASLSLLARPSLLFVEIEVPDGSRLVGMTARDARFRQELGVELLAIRRASGVVRTRLRDFPFEAGDRLLVFGEPARLVQLEGRSELSAPRPVDPRRLPEEYQLEERLLVVRLPEGSTLVGETLEGSQLAQAFGLTALAILRADDAVVIPDAGERLAAGDRLLLRGRRRDLEVLGALEGLRVADSAGPDLADLESDEIGLAEASLAPRTTLEGKTPRELRFWERYGVSILALWRRGHVVRSDMSDVELRLGDAFLVYGPRSRIDLLARDPEFLVLSPAAREIYRTRKAPVSVAIMLGVLATVVGGLLPIYLAAPLGAALMVLTRCLTIEEAYRSVELKAIVLIAGMLSLGLAMEESGAAAMVAHRVLGTASELGPMAVIASLFLLTALSAQVMPTAAVAVLLAPIALSSAAELGLSPRSLMMVVAIGSSCAFMSPVGHPVNLLVMGFGGYRFADYTKVGLPLTLLLVLVVLFVLPLFWPIS